MDKKFEPYLDHYYRDFQRFTDKETNEILEKGLTKFDLFRLEYMLKTKYAIDFNINKILKEIGFSIQVRDKMRKQIKSDHIETFYQKCKEYKSRPVFTREEKASMEEHGMTKKDLANLFYLTNKK